MARSKLTPAVRTTILTNLAHGAPVQTACAAVGINRSTFYDWKEKGEAGQEPFATFFHEVERAEAQAEMARLQIVEEATREDWKAAIWWLERRHPETWGRRDRFEHSSPPGQPVQVRHEGSLDPYLPVVAQLVVELEAQGRQLAAQEGDLPDGRDPSHPSF